MRRLTTEKFIEEARKIHGDKYDYSKVEYKNSKAKVCIICPEHGEFWQIPNSHLLGHGCPWCAGVNKNTNDDFVNKAKIVHKNKYDYSKVEYVNSKTKVIIICPEHGEFLQTPSNHLKGAGCPICAIEANRKERTLTKDEFIAKARKVHGDKYDYSKVEYINCDTKVCIVCPKHGEFWQTPNMHMNQGEGCPRCSSNISNGELEIVNYLQSLGIRVIQKEKTILNGLEIDIFLPEHNVGIEYNGLRWHSEEFGKDRNYHLNKTEECNKHGIKLIQIFEDEYVNNKELVIEKIRHIIGKDDKPKIMARKCSIKEIEKETAEIFLNRNHIQGFANSSIYLGCFSDETLVGVMTFKKEKDNKWELNRFATDYDYVCMGIGGKLFKHFLRNYHPMEIKSFADRRWTLNDDNNLYVKLGFKLDKVLKPDYHYLFQHKRMHKFNFRKEILHKKYNLPLTITETEMTNIIGAYKIWDCGLYKYVYMAESK